MCNFCPGLFFDQQITLTFVFFKLSAGLLKAEVFLGGLLMLVYLKLLKMKMLEMK